jgi:hypothetical protein
MHNIPIHKTITEDEPKKMINYLVRFHLGAESGFQALWRTHGTIEATYHLGQGLKTLSQSPTKIIAATVVLVQMINATISTAFYDDNLTSQGIKNTLDQRASLFGSALKTIDNRSNNPSILSSVHHLSKFLFSENFFIIQKFS